MPILDAIALTSSDWVQTRRFYEILGFEFDPIEIHAKHIEPKRRPGEPRLMFDHVELMIELSG